MSDPKKYRKCPHCKSNKGYKVTIILGGYQEEERTFSGKVLNVERYGADKLDNRVECLNCGNSIPTENVKTDL